MGFTQLQNASYGQALFLYQQHHHSLTYSRSHVIFPLPGLISDLLPRIDIANPRLRGSMGSLQAAC